VAVFRSPVCGTLRSSIGRVVCVLAVGVLAVACTGEVDRANTLQASPSTSESGGAVMGPASTQADSSSRTPKGCLGAGQIPEISDVPASRFGNSQHLTDPTNSYRILVQPPEESQNSDLPTGGPQEILVVPITLSVDRGSVPASPSDFAVYDNQGIRCTVPEDQDGYPTLEGTLTSGQSAEGVLAAQVLTGTTDLVVVYQPGGVPLASWSPRG
jgi:hypothetical protein